MIELLKYRGKRIPHGGYDVRYIYKENQSGGLKSMFRMNTCEIVYFFRIPGSLNGDGCFGFSRKLNGSKWGIILHGFGNVYALGVHSREYNVPFSIFLCKIMFCCTALDVNKK